MTPLAATIVHPATADAIAAYLASSPVPVSTRRLRQYVRLMHYHTGAAADWALWTLQRAERIEHVACGVWRGRGEIVYKETR